MGASALLAIGNARALRRVSRALGHGVLLARRRPKCKTFLGRGRTHFAQTSRVNAYVNPGTLSGE